MKRFPKFSVTQVQQPLNEKEDIEVRGLRNSLSCQGLSDTALQKLRSLDFLS